MGSSEKLKEMRLVIDTNVLLSALLFPDGSLTWLRNAWKSAKIRPLTSQETVIELIRTLSYPKFNLTTNEQQSLLADYLTWCEPVTTSKQPIVPKCRDPNDRCFLELALVGNACALITGDRDLLSLTSDFSIPILTPADLKVPLNVAEKH